MSEEEILHELYRRSFAASEPPADWDEMLKNATINEEGDKEIPFMEHECSLDKLQEIFNDVMNENNIPEDLQEKYSFSFYLGCSPKTKVDNLKDTL